MKKLTFIICLILSSTSWAFDYEKAVSQDGLEYIFNLEGKKGLVLCFHGSGGSATGWINQAEKKMYLENLQDNGISFVCPTSKNRKSKRWDTRSIMNNQDVERVDDLLARLGVSPNEKIFLSGHSNGGGFVSFYSILSTRSNKIKGAHYSNASGMTKIIERSVYTTKSLFSYAKCDPILDYRKIEDNIDILKKRLGRKMVDSIVLDRRHRIKNTEHCHKFLDTSKEFLDFFL